MRTSDLEKKAKYKVPFGTVSITDEARQFIEEALTSNWVTRGKYVEAFEKKFAQTFGVRHALAVSSGTDADAIACAVLYDFGAHRGDEVIVPALTFVATANAVCQAGLKPVFVDIRKETLNMDPDKIEAAITEKTRAILLVHLMGKPADMDRIGTIARKHSLTVIEDAAEAHGAEYKGKLIGTFGEMAAFSLYAAHIITSVEGGMLLTNDDRMSSAMRSLRNHGIINKFEFHRIGFSAKMNELEAAIGLGNIKIFQRILNKRRENLLYLIKIFERFDPFFITIREESHEKIGPHAFSIILKEGLSFSKDEFVRYLDEAGIDSRNLFYAIPTQCPAYSFLGYHKGDFPEAEYSSDHGIHIGIHQDLNREHLDYVVEVVEQFLKSKGLKLL